MSLPLALPLALSALSLLTLPAQNANDTPEAHLAAAKAAAAGRGGAPRGGGGRAPGPPDKSTWHLEPVKVFDNLYFFGQSEYSVWAITTSQGIIVMDTIFDYSVEDEVVE